MLDISDRTVVLALQEITEQLWPGGEVADSTVRDAVEAGEVVAELLRAGGRSDNGEIAGDPIVARRMLELLLGDQDTRATAEATLADPPADEQLSVETAVTTVVVLAAAISWLQTKVDIKIHRKNGKIEASFTLQKNAAAGNSLERLATLLYEIFNGRS